MEDWSSAERYVRYLRGSVETRYISPAYLELHTSWLHVAAFTRGVDHREPTRLDGPRTAVSSSRPVRPYDCASVDLASCVGLTVFGCEDDEADLFDRLGPRVGVAPTLTSECVSEATVAAAAGNSCVSVGHKSAVPGGVLRALRDVGVKYMSTRSIGVDHIDLHAAGELGITVENVGYAPDGVADFTVMLILMAIRDAFGIVSAANKHDFRLRAQRGKDLCDLTVGVVGVGNIGSAVIRRLRGFGCRVLACSTALTTADADLVSLDEVIGESDIVTLHLPLNGDTHHFIGRSQIARMKPGAYLVNTGRGALVDTAALVTALEHGQLGGAALDVLEGEDGIFYADRRTNQPDHRLLLRLQQMSSVIITPHTAYHTERALRDTVERTLNNCVNFERNRANDDETQDCDLVRGLL